MSAVKRSAGALRAAKQIAADYGIDGNSPEDNANDLDTLASIIDAKTRGGWTPGSTPKIKKRSTIIQCLVTVEDDYGAGIERHVFEAFYGTTPRNSKPGWYTGDHRRDELKVVAWMPKPKPFLG